MSVIADRRRALNMTQLELSQKIGVREYRVSVYEHKKAMPRANVILKLAQALQCSPTEILQDFAE